MSKKAKGKKRNPRTRVYADRTANGAIYPSTCVQCGGPSDRWKARCAQCAAVKERAEKKDA